MKMNKKMKMNKMMKKISYKNLNKFNLYQVSFVVIVVVNQLQ